MAEGSDNGDDSTADSGTSSTSSSSTSSSDVSSDTGLGGEGGSGESSSNNDDSDASNTAPSVDTSVTAEDPSKADNTGYYSFSGAIDASLTDAVTSLSLSKNDAEQAASRASFGSLATDAAVGHFGAAALQGTVAGLVSHSGKVGLSAAANAATNPVAIASTLSNVATKGYGMTTTAHDVGGMIGSHLGAALGPVGAVAGGFLGTIAAEGILDWSQAREHEMARDVLEDHLGPLEGRRSAAEMSDLAFSGFINGINDPSLGHLDAYTAGAIGQAQTISNALSNIEDPTAGLGNMSITSINGMDTSITPSMDMSIPSVNVEAAIDRAANAPDRSSEIGWGSVAPSVSAKEASMGVLGGNSGFTPTHSYGWLSAGLPVSAPSSLYKSSYWDGTRFVNMNDYKGFM